MAKKKIKFMCTAFRDGFQSVYGSRVLSKDYMPVVAEAVKAGITHIESGGGAAFQSAFFYNNENAFDVMDAFRRACGPNVILQTLARGVNVVALDSQSSEMISLHAKLFKKHGVSIIRNFDALNDPENLIYSAACIKKAGLKHQLCVAMMALPPGADGAHTPAFYIETLKKFIKAKIPFDSICFKDASGTSVPATIYETIKRARKLLGPKTMIEFHSHETAGVGLAGYLAAIEAGADMVDLSLAPVSGGTCQTDVATMWHALRGSAFELDCDIDKIMALEEVFKDAMAKYFVPPESKQVEPMIPFSPMPGGALTSNTQMLRDNHLMHKYPAIIAAMQEVVRKGGFGTSVTPVSQFYFQQAFNNVTEGPWKKIAEGYGKMVLGYFGKTPVAPDKKVVQIAAAQLGLKPTTEPVLKLNDKNPKKSRAAYEDALTKAGLPVTDENVFIAASCGDKGIDFLLGKGKVAVRYNEPPQKEAGKSDTISVAVGGESFIVRLSGNKAVVNGKEYDISSGAVAPSVSTSAPAAAPAQSGAPAGTGRISTSTPGTITKILVAEGDTVAAGQNLCVIEVMKMETFVRAARPVQITRVLISAGDKVAEDQFLFEVRDV